LATLARLTAFLLLVSIATSGFTLSDYTKVPPESWKKPTDMPPLKLGYWDFRQFNQCHVPLVLLTKRPKDERLPKSVDDKPISREAVWNELVAAVNAWNTVQPAVLKIDLTDNSPGWPVSGEIPMEPYQDDSMNAVFWMDFQGQGLGLEPGQTKPHPASSWLGIEEEMHNTDIRLMLHQIRWTTDETTHSLSANPKIVDIRTVAIHEIGHFLGLGHTSENPADEAVPELGDPVMFYKASKVKRELHGDDKRGLNFLYTPDLGDAPDPVAGSGLQSQTKVHTTAQRKTADGKPMTLNGLPVYAPGKGAVHLLGYPPYDFEWLGDKIDGECEAKQTNRDDSDDGVEIRPTWVIQQNLRRLANLMIKVKISLISDQKILAERYDVDWNKRGPNEEPKDDRAIYLNAWADWKKVDNYWTPDEKIIGTGSPAGTQKFVPGRGGGVILSKIERTYSIEAPKSAITELYEITEDDVKHGVWLRFRLDYAEDAGAKRRSWSSPDLNGPEGMAVFGEVEDWPIPLTDTSSGPVQPVSFSFKIPVGSGGTCKGKTPELGSIQISEIWATVTNCSTGQPLPEGTQVTFTVNLKAGVEKLQSVSDIDRITVSAPGFEPTTVQNFTVQTVSVPSLPPAPSISIKIINVGTVCLKPK
jgi:hypothetical protein